MKKIICIALVICCTVALCGENVLKNGDFEQSRTAKDFPGFDYIRPEKQQFCEIDREIKHSGNASLRISGLEKTWIGFNQHSVKMEEFKRPFLIRGWAKYENLVTQLPDGRMGGMPLIGLWTRTKNGKNGPSIGIPCFAEGSKDWFYFEQVFTPNSLQKRFSHLKADNAVASFTFRINVASQTGTVWFDDLEMIELAPEPLAASLPVKDVSTDVLKVNVKADVFNEKCAVTMTCGTKKVSAKLSSEQCILNFPVGELTPGKYVLIVAPETGFPTDTTPIELDFTKQANAFEEE